MTDIQNRLCVEYAISSENYLMNVNAVNRVQNSRRFRSK